MSAKQNLELVRPGHITPVGAVDSFKKNDGLKELAELFGEVDSEEVVSFCIVAITAGGETKTVGWYGRRWTGTAIVAGLMKALYKNLKFHEEG